jgi:hypothetical protein
MLPIGPYGYERTTNTVGPIFLASEEQYKINTLSFEKSLQVIDKIMFARCLFGHLAGHIFVAILEWRHFII